ncbi:duf6 domain protein [Stylonychia lemnae]|uniref:Duf6 domain protein n=1 Tax=Stylonychia lemnae TaxID=5949 RepID=A0A078AJI0_STYLE|nr:duf6 domain protein [Stylonychia lemnae]|eukprot:CDW82510.1 duf6 domain protein [Stylonychia lemnae]
MSKKESLDDSRFHIPNSPYQSICLDSSREIELTTLGDFSDTDHAPKQMEENLFTQQNSIIQQNQNENKQKFDLARAKGFFFMVISALMTTCMNLIIKYQAKNTKVNAIQAVIMRSLFLAGGSYIHLKKDKLSIIGIPQKLWWLIVTRGLFGLLSTISLYAALDYLPLSQCITVYYTQPIFVAIACYIFLGEKLAKLEIISVFSAMFGVVLLTQPQLIFPSLVQENQTSEEFGPKDMTQYFVGIFLSLFGAISGTMVYIVCRKIGKELHVSVHSFFFAVVTAFGGFIALSFTSYTIAPLGIKDILLTSLCGLCSWLQQECMSMALQIEKGGRSASVNYLVVVNAFLADVAIFGEPVVFTDILGALCIVFFTFLNAFLKCFGQSK